MPTIGETLKVEKSRDASPAVQEVAIFLHLVGRVGGSDFRCRIIAA
jgi:hypothetical protein